MIVISIGRIEIETSDVFSGSFSEVYCVSNCICGIYF